ncbi:MAG TPA: Rne/Rng family ribonuclease [Candidatus Acidoferrales bacterium]|nr:Rne/Rng family ribonuclease [Candidatus Acidoferrales bacterium]
MSKEMVVSANPHETRVAILEEGQLCEIYVEREKEFALVGSIYKGRVTRVLPGMQSAFVDIGLDSDAFLYVSDFLQEIEDMDHDAENHGSSAPPPRPHKESQQSSESSVTALPGESISGGGESAGESAPDDLHGNDSRGNYAPRPSSGEGRSRDFRRGDGRGRDRGRGGRGRHGRGGRDRGGHGRYGRELPQSKYASHRPYEPPEQNSPAEPFEAVVLPGESLSAAQHHPPVEAKPAESSTLSHLEQPGQSSEPREQIDQTPLSSEMSSETAAEQGEAPNSSPTDVLPIQEQNAASKQEAEPQGFYHYQSRFSRGGRGFERGRGRGGRGGFDRGRPHERHGDFRRDRSHDRSRDEERRDTPQGWITSLEPLPGESLAKAKAHDSLAQSDEQTAPAEANETHKPVLQSFEPEQNETSAEASIASESSRGESAASEPIFAEHPDLTEEEATSLAEHVAEVQQEEAEREAEERAEEASFNENGAAGDIAEESESESESEAEDESQEISEVESHEHAETESEEDDSEDSAAESVAEDELGPLAEISESDSEAIEVKEGEEVLHEELAASAETESQPTEARIRSDFRARMQRPMRRGGRDHDRDRGRRGRRPFRGHMRHRGQPRRNQLISELLKAGQEIIVQIAKEPLGKKGARITSHISLPGRFLVYMPTLDHTGISRKIASAEERSRLRHLVNDAKGSASGGFIVRTAAASASPDEVREDVQFLTKTWADLKGHSEQRKAPSLLHRDINLVERILRDYLSDDYSSIWVDSEEEYTKILEFVSRFQPALANRVKLFTKSTPIFEEFGIQQEIDKGLRPKVWLKSGGYIVINHTEALVAIDVNTGKFVGRGSTRLEDTIVRTNIEAVKEIVRQIRLRDLGGIIIIDFIDMEERRNREKVMAALEEALKADRAPSKVLRFNEFGLVAITRKRTKQALERTLCQPCPYCTGSGMVKSVPTLCYEIQTEARKMAPEIEAASLTLRVHPEIAKALKTRESALMDELEQVTHKSLIIQADPTLHWEQYDIY